MNADTSPNPPIEPPAETPGDNSLENLSPASPPISIHVRDGLDVLAEAASTAYSFEDRTAVEALTPLTSEPPHSDPVEEIPALPKKGRKKGQKAGEAKVAPKSLRDRKAPISVPEHALYARLTASLLEERFDSKSPAHSLGRSYLELESLLGFPKINVSRYRIVQHVEH